MNCKSRGETFVALLLLLQVRPFLSYLCASVSKRVLGLNLAYENEFDLNENEPEGETHFCTRGFARRLFLTQRQRETCRWLIDLSA